jgi:hypothetical protein
MHACLFCKPFSAVHQCPESQVQSQTSCWETLTYKLTKVLRAMLFF